MMSTLLRFLLSFFCFLASTNISAQCGITVDAGPDASFCPGGGLVQLNASISGSNLSNFSWSPTTGLDNPNSLTPRATVSGPIIYTLTAEVFDPATNLIVNGSFDAGDSDFTTDYSPGSGGPFGLLSDEGEYVISTNSSLTHSNFASCNDRSGGGNMMVINGSGTANDNVWCQTVAVAPNVTYSFNAWLQSVISQNPAQLQFSVNGVLLGNDFRASSTACAWNQFTEIWESGAATSAQICITNQNTGGSGNDFAIDDLFFGPICIQTDEVEINEIFVEAQAVSPVSFPCDPGNGNLQLDGTGSSDGPFYFYQWTTTNGNIVSGVTTRFPTVDEPGEYVLTTRFDDGVTLCTDQAFVTVNANNNIPTAVATPQTAIVSCREGTAILTATGSSTGPAIVYEWITNDGNIVSGGSTDQATVDQAGTYELVVTNSIEGCFDVATVVVTADTDPPVPDILNPVPFTCNITSQNLNASNSVTGSNFTLSWTTADGNIVGGANGLDPLVDALGTYTLTITNEDNGCSASSSVTVVENIPDLEIILADPPPLDCSTPAFRINATGTTAGPDIRYAWTTNDGSIAGNANGQMPLVDEPGTYVLLLTDRVSGCTLQDSVTVLAGAGPPSIALQSPPLFTCARAQITLDASGTSTGPDLRYAWSTSDGNIVSGGDSLAPVVTGPGTFTLTVRDIVTNCQRDTTITIGSDLNAPLADAGSGFVLDCGKLTDTLDGTASAQGPNLSYDWTTGDGVIVADTNAARLVIGSPGTYTLRVTDTNNGCSATSAVVILRDNSAPDFTIAPAMELTCENQRVQLNSTTTGNPPGLIYAWTTNDGNFTASANGAATTVDAPGTYQLAVTDPANGCTTTQSVFVSQNIEAPAVEAGPSATLTCTTPSLRLMGTDLGPGFSYQWSTADGTIEADAGGTNPLVTSAATYYLVATNDVTGCFERDSVVVMADQIAPTVDLGSVPGITCNQSEINLNDGVVAGPNLTYRWATPDGNLLSPADTATVTVNDDGTYTLTVTDTLNGCSAMDVVSVSFDTLAPVLTAAPPAALTCTANVVDLSGNVVGAGANPLIGWSTPDGNFVSGQTSLTPRVDAPGNYLLRAENPATGCLDSLSVTVVETRDLPRAAIAPPGLLTCIDNVLTLDGSQSDEDQNFSWTWGTDDGNFVGLVTDLTPEVDQAGTYFITVSNLTTGCMATDTVVVLANQVIPDIDVGPTERTLTCVDTFTVLGGAAGAMPGLSYRWTALEGTAPSSQNEPTTRVQTAGIYELRITNDTTGCVADERVTVRVNQDIPAAAIVPVDPLNCTVLERTLTAVPPSPGQAIAYRWATTAGNIAGQNGSAEITVNRAGTYQLFTFNVENGCTDSTTTMVGQDTILPRINLPIPEQLTCRNPLIELSANFSGAGSNFSINWLTEDGNIVSGGNTSRPTVNAAGTYVLTITNGENNCSSATNVLVERNDTPPALSAAVPEELNCRVLTSQINVTNTTFGTSFNIAWSTADGNLLEGENTLTPTVDQPGTYELTVIDEGTACRSSIRVLVTRDVTPPTVDLGAGYDLGCEVKPVVLDAGAGGTGPFTYNWITADGVILSGENLGRPTVQGGGTYLVEVTDQQNFCTASAEITLIQNLLLGFDAERTVPTCREPFGSILFTEVDGGTAPFLYSIDGGDGFNPATFADSLAPGRYDLVVQDANGCETSEALLIPNAPELDLFVDPRAVIELGDNYFINTRSNFADSSLTSVIWTPTLGLDCTDCLRPTASPTETTTYTISVVSSDGCTATDSVQLVVDDLLRIYFPTGFSPNGDGLNDVFLPLGDPAVISSIQDFTIFDRWGEAVHNATNFLPNDPANGWDGHLNGRPLNPAVYVYTATVAFTNGRVVTFKGDLVLMK